MKLNRIECDGKLLAVFLKSEDWVEGLNFMSSDDDYLQVGTWNYNKGKKLLPHMHLEAMREIERTQEVVYVKEGKLKVDIYSDDKKYLKSLELNKGDTLLLLSGGHGYEILEDNTQILETKNGPYVGAEKDRVRI